MIKIGIQLFSVRDKCTDAAGMTEAIRSLSQMGYDGVEFCSYAGIPHQEMRRILKENGIEGFNSHVHIHTMEEDLQREIDYALGVGMEAVTIPYIHPDRRTEAGYREICGMLPGYVKAFGEAGLRLCYHNHDFEYVLHNNRYLLDQLLDTDSNLLLELDTFWTMYAGFDPLKVMEQYAGRIKYLHIKDYTDKDTMPRPLFCAIGHGKMDNASILRKAGETGVEWVVVEQDNSQIDTLESARLSLEAIKGLQG